MEKNRESARNSRKRKKVYFQLLTQTAIDLKKEIHDINEKIKEQELQNSEVSEVKF